MRLPMIALAAMLAAAGAHAQEMAALPPDHQQFLEALDDIGPEFAMLQSAAYRLSPENFETVVIDVETASERLRNAVAASDTQISDMQEGLDSIPVFAQVLKDHDLDASEVMGIDVTNEDRVFVFVRKGGPPRE